MIDLHCHILPGIDDGAADMAVALEMARALVADRVVVAACTPHILPGLYHNSGPQILAAVAEFQDVLESEGIPLRLVAGADNHIVPDFAARLRTGHLLPLAGSNYVLIEPPHNVVPQRMEDLFFSVQASGFFPILTHPERLTWLPQHYEKVRRLVQNGVWMQVTAGSLTGAFGRSALYWAERMLDEGLVHILATDAHDNTRRPPRLSEGFCAAAKRVGEAEAANLVFYRPRGILESALPATMSEPPGMTAGGGMTNENAIDSDRVGQRQHPRAQTDDRTDGGGFAGRLRRLFA